jgi:hypothetical protein
MEQFRRRGRQSDGSSHEVYWSGNSVFKESSKTSSTKRYVSLDGLCCDRSLSLSLSLLPVARIFFLARTNKKKKVPVTYQKNQPPPPLPPPAVTTAVMRAAAAHASYVAAAAAAAAAKDTVLENVVNQWMPAAVENSPVRFYFHGLYCRRPIHILSRSPCMPLRRSRFFLLTRCAPVLPLLARKIQHQL